MRVTSRVCDLIDDSNAQGAPGTVELGIALVASELVTSLARQWQGEAGAEALVVKHRDYLARMLSLHAQGVRS